MAAAPIRLTAFDRLGKAYLHFAKSEPAYYSAMFEAGIPLEIQPRAAGGRRAGFRGAADRHRADRRHHAGEEIARRC